MDNYFKIGRLAASIGLEGEIILEHNLGNRSDLKGVQAIFISSNDDKMLPYFLASTKASMPHQTLCTIIIKEKEVMIPVHPDNTIRLDKKEKTIEVDVPDGLLEIYE